jgi:hypothetical protein
MRTPTLKGLNMNSPRCNLGKGQRRAPTLKGLNMKRRNERSEIIRNKKRVKKNEQNKPIFNTPPPGYDVSRAYIYRGNSGTWESHLLPYLISRF